MTRRILSFTFPLGVCLLPLVYIVSTGDAGQTGSPTKYGPSQLTREVRSPLTVAHAYRGSAPRSLEILARADWIVVGKVIAVERENNTPIGSEEMSQHTVFSFDVALTLNFPKNRQPAKRMLVRQEQGHRRWTQLGATGVGFRWDDEPLLRPGSEYMLFLTNLYDSFPGPQSNKLERLQNLGQPDEFVLTSKPMSIYYIESGQIKVPEDAEIPPLKPWLFAEGPQLFGKTASEAIALTKKAIIEAQKEQARAEQRRKRGIEFLRSRMHLKGTVLPAEETGSAGG